MAKKILIVEDDKNISVILSENAKVEGYDYDVAYDGEDGFAKARTGDFDLILLDLMLPKMDGFEICRQLRKEKILTPIIMLTASGEETNKIMGLDIGADDYITKPFGLKDVFARIKANIRRSSAYTEENIIKIQSVAIDFEKCKVEKNNTPVELTKLEYDLLVFFAKNPDKILPHEELLKNVWKDDFYGKRTVDTAITRLRSKIEDDSSSPKIIKNMRGMGYYLTMGE